MKKNMSLTKVAMPERDPKERSTNFEEVALGYTEEMALEEAARCLGCKNMPCVSGCPVNVKIPEFIALVQEGKFIEAYEKIKETNSLPAICGRVCPAGKPVRRQVRPRDQGTAGRNRPPGALLRGTMRWRTGMRARRRSAKTAARWR